MMTSSYDYITIKNKMFLRTMYTQNCPWWNDGKIKHWWGNIDKTKCFLSYFQRHLKDTHCPRMHSPFNSTSSLRHLRISSDASLHGNYSAVVSSHDSTDPPNTCFPQPPHPLSPPSLSLSPHSLIPGWVMSLEETQTAVPRPPPDNYHPCLYHGDATRLITQK